MTDRQVRIGVSGWQYPPWRGPFYPAGVRQADELTYLSERLTSIEINSTFYSLKKPQDFAKWKAATPTDFVFSVKGGRFITHMKRLLDPEASLAKFFASGVFGLGDKLGPFLWQLPPNFSFDSGRLEAFFEALPRSAEGGGPLRHALEVRHASFAASAVAPLLRKHNIALVLGDSAGRWPVLREDTADFRYVRLHGDEELYASGYTDAALERWAGEIGRWGKDTFVYFDNDQKAFAPRDAMRLIELINRA